MNITEFFEQSAGKWFSQRTSHDLKTVGSISGKSDLWVDLLPIADPAIAQLCAQAKVDPAQVTLGVRIRWEGEIAKEVKKQTGSTVFVIVANPDQADEGRLIRKDGMPGGAIAHSRYSLGSDEVLTLITEDEALAAEERIWFASPSLRFRTSTVKHADGFSMASFCSEIRMGSPKPAPDSQQAAAQA